MLVTSVASFGAPAASAAPAAPTKAPAPEPAPALPDAQVSLTLTPGTGGALWRIQIQNNGEGPVRIPADPRLLILELTPPAPIADADASSAKKKPTPPLAPPRCILPDDIRPTTDDGRELVIPPKRSWSATFDPLFYCFGTRERAALVPGTSVKARFGWPQREGAKPTKSSVLTPPFAVAPVGASVGKVAPAKAIEADAVSLTEAVNSPAAAKPASEKTMWSGSADEAAASTVSLSIPATMDAARGSDLTTTVTLINGTDRSITLLYQANMLQFSVSGPAGTQMCGYPRTVSAPIRELFITVPAKAKVERSVLLTTTCPPGTFDEPGIYRVTPRLDTTNASGRTIGLKTWDGVAIGKTPLLLRVRSPRKPALPARPTLD